MLGFSAKLAFGLVFYFRLWPSLSEIFLYSLVPFIVPTDVPGSNWDTEALAASLDSTYSIALSKLRG